MRPDEISALLEQPLEDPQAILGALLSALADGNFAQEPWHALHQAVERHGQQGALSVAYDSLTAPGGIDLLTPDAQASVLLMAARAKRMAREYGPALSHIERGFDLDPSSLQRDLLTSELLDLFDKSLRDKARALDVAEAILAQNPTHARAREVTESCLEVRAQAPRAAAVLAALHEKAGRLELAAAMYSRQLGSAKGEARLLLQRRLAVLREDTLKDPAGALDLLRVVVAAHPEDEEVRARFIKLSLAFDEPQAAVRVLERALVSGKEPALRSRVAVEVGQIFLRLGDMRRAQGVFEQAMRMGGDPGAVLTAAHELTEIHASAGHPAGVARALEVVIRHEGDKQARLEAARRLARLCESNDLDPRRAALGWVVMLDSPWFDEALSHIEVLASAEPVRSSVLEALASATTGITEPSRLQVVFVLVARLREAARDFDGAILAWQQIAERWPGDRTALGELIRLSERESRWKPLADALEIDLELAPAEERAQLLTRLGTVQQWHLGNPNAAVAAFARALASEPEQVGARQGLERQLAAPAARLEAARALEQHYRARGAHADLVRVVEIIAEVERDPVARLVAYGEATELAAAELGHPHRALALAGRALRESVRGARDQVSTWTARVDSYSQRAMDLGARADLLKRALGQAPLDDPELVPLVRAAASALVTVGEHAAAAEILEHARRAFPSLGFEADLEAVCALPSLEERLELLQGELEHAAEEGKRRQLLHTRAHLQERSEEQSASVQGTWLAIVAEFPSDWTAHQALVATSLAAGDSKGARSHLERALESVTGELQIAAQLQLADLMVRDGESGHALRLYRDLVGRATVPEEVWTAVERLVLEQRDTRLLAEVLERRLMVTFEPGARAALLSRLGEVFGDGLAAEELAVSRWMEAAQLYEGDAGDTGQAERWYARVLQALPTQRLARERLLELRIRQGSWDALREPLGAWLHTEGVEAASWLRGLESYAIRTGVAAQYADLVLHVAARSAAEATAASLHSSVARALASDSNHQVRASELYHELLVRSDATDTEWSDFETFVEKRASADRAIEERRWLLRWRMDHAPSDIAPILEAAEMEREVARDTAAAAELYERALQLDPERTDILLVLQALYRELDDPGAAIRVASALRQHSDGELRYEADIAAAGLLMERLGCPLDALDIIEPLVRIAPVASEALRIVHLGLAHEDSRQRAATLLERATESVDDPAARVEVLQLLLETSAGVPDFEEARARWYLNLIECSAGDPEGALGIALRAVEELPGRMELWERAEQFARDLGAPEPLARAYAKALHDDLPVAAAEAIGRRMVDFHEEWFNEPQQVVELLQRVLELAPGASWAFDRLKLEFNASGQWEALFRLYDRAIAQAEHESAQADLLREVAMAAKDFAGDAERAIQYLVRLHALVPADARVEAALERLYERGGHAVPLIDLLAKRIPNSDAHQARRLKLRIAGLRLDVDQPLEALDLIEELLELPSHRGDLTELLERLVALPSSRDSLVPSSARGKKPKKTRPVSVRERAANHLKEHYDAESRTEDVVRMLEVLVDVAADPAQQARRLRRAVDVRLAKLQDYAGAFEDMLRLVCLEPGDAANRKLLNELADRVDGHARQAELLVQQSDKVESPALRVCLLSEAADVMNSALQQPGRAIELFLRVLAMAEHDETAALDAARALDSLMDQAGRHEERCAVLERRAALETEPDARRVALCDAARVAFAILDDPARAVRNWQARLADDPDDLAALDGLAEALERGQRWGELVDVLKRRALLVQSADAARADRVRVARVLAESMYAHADAIAGWMTVRELHGRDQESFLALRELLYAEQRWSDLAGLLMEEAGAESDKVRRVALGKELGELHRTRTGDVNAALEAFVGADDWDRAIQVVATAHGNRELGRDVCSSLLELAVRAWESSESEEEAGGTRSAAAWAIDELATRLLEEGRHQQVVELLIRGANLGFARERRRQMLRDAAVLCSDHLKRAERAMELYRELVMEDPGDAIAAESVTRYVALLEHEGEHARIAELWEQQAIASAARGDSGTAAALWVRAAEIWEDRIKDLDRAAEDYQRSGALGGMAGFEALARIFSSQQRYHEAAEVLEQLVESSQRERTAELALRLVDTYLLAGTPAKARAALQKAVELALDATELRRRLAVLHREAGEWQALTDLLVAEAGRTASSAERIRYLREAAEVHSVQRGDPNAAVPLLAKAVGLAPADADLRLSLAEALCAAERFPEAVLVLREQLENYGTRRPKERALVHHALAQALLAKGDRSEARVELDAANRINPAHPAILRGLARMALEDGELTRAEQTYRALLLVLSPAAGMKGPSRAEALLDLAEVAMRQGDGVRAAEFEESAFEAALESRGEALCLEAALAARGRHDLLARALEARLQSARTASEAIHALSALARLYAEHLGGVKSIETRVRSRAEELYAQLAAESADDDDAWVALGRIFESLGDAGAVARVLEQQVDALLQDEGRRSKDAGPFYRLAEIHFAEPATRARGLELLQAAMQLRPEPARAAAMLHTALDDGYEAPELADFFERVARQSGDARLLGEALLRAAQQPGARPEALREGVRVASELGDQALQERILRAALGNEDNAWSDEDAAWARMRLAERLEARGEVDEAVRLQRAAVEFLPIGEQRVVLLRIAKAADEHLGEPARAASIYEELLGHDAADRQIWEPLLGIYRRLGEPEKLVRLIGETVPLVETLGDRSRLRLEQAQLLLDQNEPERAIEQLQETLLDDPSNAQAGELLAAILERQGRVDELVHLLNGQLDAAKDAQDHQAIARLSQRIGALLEASGRNDEALTVYRSWLEWEPDRLEALRAALRTTEVGGDAYLIAEALEDLLRVERGEAGLALSARLVELRVQQADEPGVERAWRLGFIAEPHAVELRDQLLARLESREEWSEICDLLELALRANPQDSGLLSRLMTASERAGQYEEALSLLDRLASGGEASASLHRHRARLLRELRRDEEALVELERAYSLDKSDCTVLVDALEQVLLSADSDRRRVVLRRLAELRLASNERWEAKQRLMELTAEFPGDIDALRMLARLAEEDEDAQLAVSVYQQLTSSEQGEGLLHAALRLAELAEQTNALEQARAGLEHAYAAFPGEVVLLARLRDVYVRTGASMELAEILLRDADQVEDPSQQLTLLLEAAGLLLNTEEGKERVREVLQRARKLDPENVEVGVLLARALDQAGQTEEALAQLNLIVQAHRGRRIKSLAPAYEEMSDIHLREGFLSDALEALSRAFDMDLRNGPLAMKLGRLALETDNRDVALRAFRAVSMMRAADDNSEGASSSDKAEAYYQLARMAADEGDGRKARILASKAVAERSDHEDAARLLEQL